MVQSTLIVLLTLLAFSLTAQDFTTISGAVIDKKSKQPIPYASVSIKTRSIGTVSNSLGEFEFHIPDAFMGDTIYVTHIGYKTLKFSIKWLTENRVKQFALEEDVKVLDEVFVTADRAKAKVEQALRAIPNNFPVQPYIMDAFHRSWEMVDFVDSISYPGTIVESALIVYDPGYTSSRKITEKTYTREIRRSKLMAGWNYSTAGVVGERLFRENQVKYNQLQAQSFLTNFLEFPNDLEYSLEDVLKYDGEDVDVISVQVPNSRGFPAEYKIYISQADNAILKFTLTGKIGALNYKTPYTMTNLEHVYLYKRYKGRSYLSYAKIQYQLKKVNLATKNVTQVESYFNELLVSEIVTDNVEALHRNYAKTLRKKSPILETGKYNEAFWKSYNMVSENPMDKKILEAFEKSESLERQYQDAETEQRKKKAPK
jgi:hypothetical protein